MTDFTYISSVGNRCGTSVAKVLLLGYHVVPSGTQKFLMTTRNIPALCRYILGILTSLERSLKLDAKPNFLAKYCDLNHFERHQTWHEARKRIGVISLTRSSKSLRWFNEYLRL